MDKFVIFMLALMTYTGVSVGTIGKALLTPLHLVMGILMGYIIAFAPKARYHLPMTLLMLVGYIVFTNLFIYPEARITSVIYTFLFSFEYIIMYHLMMSVKQETIIKALQFIIYSYMVNILLGFAFSLVHQNPLDGIVNISYSANGEGARPNGFSTEPSYAAFIVSISYMGYNHLRGHRVDRPFWQLTAAYLVCILFMKSAYGFIFVAVNGMDWFFIIFKKLRFNIKIIFLVFGIGMAAVIPMALQDSEQEAIVRLRNVATVMNDNSVDIKKKLSKLQEVDGSAYARIGPTYLLFNARDEIQIDMTLGAGAGAAGNFFKKFMAGVMVDDDADKLDMGIVPAFVFDYGYVGTVLLILFVLASAYNLPLPFWACFFLVLPNCNINTQLFWYGLVLYSYISVFRAGRLPEQLEAAMAPPPPPPSEYPSPLSPEQS
ncbi:MAG: hypothetical protein D6714_19000 [Bacteroidetes bacterium]|nr:MAG: hypothetical protein D6714_19000 [Bacteroidota bacterium]